MSNLNSGADNVDSTDVLVAILSDGLIAGLVGGMLGAVLPIIALLTGNSSTVALGFFVNAALYLATGILAGYLYYSRKIGSRWAAVVAVIAGVFAGLISGAAYGFAFSRVSLIASQMNASTNWVTWSILSALGAGFVAPLTAWIPGFFIRSDAGTPATGTKSGTIQDYFERRRKIRFAVTMVAVLLMFAIYLCGSASR